MTDEKEKPKQDALPLGEIQFILVSPDYDGAAAKAELMKGGKP